MSYSALNLRMDRLEEQLTKLEDQINKINQRLLWLDTAKRDGMEGI